MKFKSSPYKKISMTIVLGLSAFTFNATAGIISFGNTSVSSPNKTEDFTNTSTLSSEILSNQFSSNGLSFVSNAGGSPVLFNNSYCHPAPENLSEPSYASFGITTGCGTTGSTNSSILFSENVSELSFDWTSNNSGIYTFEALLDGLIVSSLNVTRSLVGSTTTFLYSGSTFDELRFRQTANTSWFWMDDLAWNANQNPNPVPEPTSLALLGLGLAGFGFSRKKKKA